MSTLTRPKGPLPSRVYWTRRVLLLVVVFALVFGAARLLGGGGDEPEPQARARSAAAPPRETPDPEEGADAETTPSAPSTSVTDEPKKKRKKVKVLAEPQGECEGSDLRVSPSVDQAHVGRAVSITLKLKTRTSPACTWAVDDRSVIVAVSSGPDPIWSSQECPRAIPRQVVVPRNNQAATITVTWSGRRSDSSCSDTTAWAKAGWYHVQAVARGSVEPVDTQFELEPPVRPEPKKKKSKKAGAAG